MSELTIEGKLTEKFTEQQISEKFKKREFVIETSENNFTELIKFELVQDRCDLIDPYQEGEMVKVSFNLKGRAWNDKYFVNVQAWKIERLVAEATGPTPPPENFEEDMSEPPF